MSLRAWDMAHVNRMNIPPSQGMLGRVSCPTEGCGFFMEGNGTCPRCGWTLIVTRKEEAGMRSDCPIVGCTIAGPHDHNPTGPWEAKESA